MLIPPNGSAAPAGAPMGRVPADAFATSMPLWVLWLFGYAYAFVIALVLQKLVMPIVPDLHAGHGLMNQDAIIFHDIAVSMADRIHASGWSEWRLMPGAGITANVGILAAIYAVFGADPVWFIPLNAGFHALGALLVLRLALYLLPGRDGWVAGSAAALLFLTFPSALVWYGQNHKDAFLIAGYLLMLFSFVGALKCPSLSKMSYRLILMGVGCGLVAIMRPHMLTVYTAAFAVGLVAILVWKIIRPGCIGSTTVRNGALMFGMMITAVVITPSIPEDTGVNIAFTSGTHSLGWRWEKIGLLPDAIDRKLEQVSFVRKYFIGAGRVVGAGSTIDGDISPVNAWEMAAYLPRALWVGLFAPFPDTWLERPTVPRLIGAVETLIFYLMAPGILILAWRKPSLPLFVCLAVSAVVLTVLSYTSPNVGTLHRIRYGQLFVFMLAGLSGWIWLLAKAGHFLGTTRDIPHGGKGDIPLAGKAPDLVPGDKISGKRAMGAGVLVTLVLMIGALGLLIRDLLLISRSDFGAPLDSFYLAMMVPMLFVNILTLPLGDALTAALHRTRERHGVQSLLGSTATVSMLALGLLCLVLFLAGGPIYRNFVAGGEITQILTLLPLALFLLFFSGLVVTGNSLLNSLGQPVLAAAAQLIVPLAAVAAILFAPEDRLIMSATAGMVAGQLLNLVILFVLARRRGFHLVPLSIKRMSGERMLANYGWLVAAALLTSLSTPFNYWLVSQLGIGSVSAWAVGSKLVQMATALEVAIISAVWLPYLSKLVTAGLNIRIRGEVYLSLLAVGWGGGLFALVVFGFSGPIVMAAMPAVQDEMRVAQLTGVIQIGALQLPLLASSFMLLKLSAVSGISCKAVAATLIGLVANVALGYTWLPVWGIFGIAAAWCIATLLTTTVIMFATRAQSSLGWGELFGIVASWLVIGGGAVAISFKSLPVTAGVILIGVLVLVTQVKTLISRRTAPEIVTG